MERPVSTASTVREMHGTVRRRGVFKLGGASSTHIFRKYESASTSMQWQSAISAFDFVIQVNLIGTFRCIAKSAAGMMSLDPLSEDGDRGAIVNTASVAAEDGQMGQAAYSASKGGVVGMTLPIARDLMREGIRVNTILPGIFNTPLMNAAPPQVKEALAASVPFPKRLGNAEEYANLAMCMIETGYFNGEDVRLDGAIRMAPR